MEPAPHFRNPSHVWDLIVGPEAGAFSRCLYDDHLDSTERLALFQTCHAAKDLVLTTAERPVINVEVHNDSVDVIKRTRMLKALLKPRGVRPCKLQLHDSKRRQDWILGILDEVAACVDSLELLTQDDELHDGAPLPTSLLTTCGRCCPNLSSLQLVPAYEPLPDLKLLPCLKQIAAYMNKDLSRTGMKRFYRSLAPYLTRLTHLHLEMPSAPSPPELLTLLFQPTTQNMCHHLTCLDIDAILNNAFLGLLLACAPALEQLSVRDISVESDMHAQTANQWQRLTSSGVTALSSLPRLPLSNTMTLSVPWLYCDVTNPQEAQAVMDTVKSVESLTHGAARLLPAPGVAMEDRPAAIRVGFDILHAFTPPLSKLTLAAWTMSAPLMREFHRMPACHTVELRHGHWLPGRHLYTSLLRLLPGSCHEVVIAHPNNLTRDQMHDVCCGAPLDRPPEQPFSIQLQGTPEDIASVQQRLAQGVLPNVVVSPF